MESSGCETVTNVDDSPDGAYLEWLYSQVGIVQNRNPARSHWKLLIQLYSTQFVWFVPNDDNRVEDGKALRPLFLQETRYKLDDPHGLFFSIECSILEMIIALARRAATLSDGQPAEWFWRMIHNLGFDGCTDDIWEVSMQEDLEETLHRLNGRTYLPSGEGGLFPLHEAENDQRKVELWYQLQAYVYEGAYATIMPRF